MSQPTTKKPTKNVAYPPKGYLKTHRVKSGENWWTLQEKYGFKDAWDLIRYNFRTKNPDEVNWCLKNLVGCSLTTADKKNYRFSSDAFPGLIYLPPRSFQHGTGGGAGATPITLSEEDQQAMDRQARADVLQALGHTAALKNVDFNIGGFTVTPAKLENIRTAIRSGAITVRHEPNASNMAFYDPDFDVIYLGVMNYHDQDAIKALIIHECTHAMMDMYCTQIWDVQAEAFGYIAQQLYYLGRRPNAQAPLQMVDDDLKILQPAFQYAKFLTDLRKGLASNDPASWRIAGDALVRLTTAVKAHKVYEGQFKKSNELRDGRANYDGVDGWCYEDPDA